MGESSFVDDQWGSFRQSKLRRLLRLLSPCLEMLAATAFPGSAAVISRHEALSSGFWFPSSACYLDVCGFWHRLFVVVTPHTFSLPPWSFGGMVSQCRVAFCVSADVILEGSGRLSLSSSGGRVSFWTRALHGCLYISRPGGRARFCGPRVRWAWACGWDAGGPLFTSLRGSGDAWARGILDLAPFCFPALQPVFPAAPGSSSLEWSAPPLPSSFVFLFATSPQLLHPLHLMVYAPLPSCSDHHELLLCTGYKHGQLTQF